MFILSQDQALQEPSFHYLIVKVPPIFQVDYKIFLSPLSNSMEPCQRLFLANTGKLRNSPLNTDYTVSDLDILGSSQGYLED